MARFARSLLWGALVLGACVSPSRVVVHPPHLDSRTAPDIAGQDIEAKVLPTEGFTDPKPGYYAVKSSDDWLLVWKDPRPDVRHPPVPAGIDFKTQMLVVAAFEGTTTTGFELSGVRKSPDGLHVYLTETLAGEGCKAAPAHDQAWMIVAAVETTDADVHFHTDRLHEDRCSAVPEAKVLCRVAGSGQAGTEKMIGQPGQTIDCDGAKSTSATGTSIVDRNWFLEQSPLGSTVRTTVTKTAMGVTFPLDAWGSYVVRHEVSDDTGKMGRGTATVDVPPPSGVTAVELVWSHYDRSDDPSTFPRVQLHLIEHPAPLGERTRDCYLDAEKPGWCEIAEVGVTQQAKLKPADKKRYRVEVRYVDDRFKGAPVACVRTFPAGAKPLDICEYPDTERKAGSVWSLGALDLVDGTFADPNAPPKVVIDPDAGAPLAADGGVSTDAGVKDATAPAAPKDAGAPKAAPVPKDGGLKTVVVPF